MSDSSTHTEWAQSLQRRWQPSTAFDGFPPMSEATVVTAVSSPGTTGGGGSGTGNSNAISHSSMEGRVGKTPRRRSRASRKPPTTLLNTDTTNFRAMVQQFTGGPSAAYVPGFQSNSPGTMNLGYGGGRGHRQSMTMAQYHQLQLQHQHQHQNQQQYVERREEPMISLGNPGDMFLEASEGLLLNNVMSRPPRATGEDNRNYGYSL
ncbi:hypothetical protein QJS04_geneDACA014365 [Acorus gramineus]|uniref:VQ domain-containing protein n=1 Tax=Acorus gramineus TaxID=55184 RepID=A0AAV8ZX23_ACOGR|nr:hypothetical protein QJS04_geneDACA014365 [Acorus gramineus]